LAQHPGPALGLIRCCEKCFRAVQSATYSTSAVADKVSSSPPKSIIVHRRRSLTALGSDRTRVDPSVSRRSCTRSPTDGGTTAIVSLPVSDRVVNSRSWPIPSGTSRIWFLSRDSTYNNDVKTLLQDPFFRWIDLQLKMSLHARNQVYAWFPALRIRSTVSVTVYVIVSALPFSGDVVVAISVLCTHHGYGKNRTRS